MNRIFQHALASAVVMLVVLGVASAQAGVIAYYSFDSSLTADEAALFTDANTPGSPNNLTQDGASGSAIVLSTAQPTLSGSGARWPTAGSSSSNRSLQITSGVTDTNYSNFTGSIWAYLDPAANSVGWTGGGSDRFLFGQRNNGNNSGWAMFANKDNPEDIRLLINGSGPTTPGVSTIGNSFGAGVNTVPHNIATTFDGATGTLKIFIDGILAASQNYGGGSVLPNDANNQKFSIGNEGDQRNASSARSWSGTLDDAVFRNDTLNDQQVALIHALGRFQSVEYKTLDGSNRVIDNTYQAYVNQTSYTINGVTWYYHADLGVGSPGTGRIGGSIGGGDAYIVLSGTSGLNLVPVPEASTMAMAAFGLLGMVLTQLRRRV